MPKFHGLTNNDNAIRHIMNRREVDFFLASNASYANRKGTRPLTQGWVFMFFGGSIDWNPHVRARANDGDRTSISEAQYEMMSALDGTRITSSFEHQFHSITAKAKYLKTRVDSGETFVPVAPAKKRGLLAERTLKPRAKKSKVMDKAELQSPSNDVGPRTSSLSQPNAPNVTTLSTAANSTLPWTRSLESKPHKAERGWLAGRQTAAWIILATRRAHLTTSYLTSSNIPFAQIKL
ncbi:hypothetical protein CC80DRAFT_553646 [Byssothecium circinans]|uniref:Uncharacterized protein n=1 Tax=Byssothecium circinans TaxID=147558 RepID=A0A6A5TKA2_9PLEO|nr:hypothetical protein CC80DRAFT_553646 [Byssothecium circinans]